MLLLLLLLGLLVFGFAVLLLVLVLVLVVVGLAGGILVSDLLSGDTLDMTGVDFRFFDRLVVLLLYEAASVSTAGIVISGFSNE